MTNNQLVNKKKIVDVELLDTSQRICIIDIMSLNKSI